MTKEEFENIKIKNLFERLAKSKFRSRFKLTNKEWQYIQEKGMDEIEKHAYDFITKRLAPSFIENDGKQTPMRGHPVFFSQHATATCCRGCLYKWHGIRKDRELTDEEIDYIVKVIMCWIRGQKR